VNVLLSVLAEQPKNTGPDFGKASPIGLLIVVILLICVFALVWSMNRHLKKLPQSFDPPPAEPVDSSVSDVVAGSEPEVKKPPHEPGG
jgi:hypothetical protein